MMTLRPRPVRIEHVVDGEKLRAQLSAAALSAMGEPQAARKAALNLLHGALFRGRMIAKERLEDGGGGLESAALLSAVADAVIQALFDFTTVHMFRARNPTQGERFAVVAVGGYGRSQMAPSSDIDLLFLRNYKLTPWTESVTEFMLYMLWDMSLKVGHSSRTVDECLRLAREDHTIQTALLEARHLAGDRSLTEEFMRRFRTDVAAPERRAFVQAKLKEREERHLRSGASLYLVEPNVKEGKGALRDLHTMSWIIRHAYDLTSLEEWAKAGIFTRTEIRAFERAAELFWRVRAHLHFLTGRAEERLTFDVQPELAKRMGYRDRSDRAAVERFMKRYFLAAHEVGQLFSALVARLEDEQLSRPLRASFFSNLGSPKKIENGFSMSGGRVSAEPAAFDRDPLNLLRIFVSADLRDADLHPHAQAEIMRRLGKINALRRDPRAQKVFLEAVEGRVPGKTLTMMNEAGVLGRFVPEFGRVVAQMQFNMYHHYTVDEHTLRAVQIISDIERGQCASEHPLATAILPKILHRRALYLAMLLHDVGKGEGDQQVEGAKAARQACERLNLPEDEVALVAWLVGHHLEMSDVAQKRDIGDPRTIASFADMVGDVERLRLLLVLTVADIRAVGPAVWNSWKGQLLRDLYRLTEATLHGGRTDEAHVRERIAAQAGEAKAALKARLSGERREVVSYWMDRLDDAYWVATDSEALLWHGEQMLAARQAGGVHVAARPSSASGATEILVYAPDRQGLFASLTAALADCGADVADARVYTTPDGQAFDVFSTLDVLGKPFGMDDPDMLQRLLQKVRAAALGEGLPMLARKSASPRRAAAFSVEPWVRVDSDLSEHSTVLEVSGRDRTGLLAELAGILAEEKLSVISAHIDAYGERVADVFYIRDLEGRKLTDPARIEALQKRLLEALRNAEPDAPADPRKTPMAVARASRGR